MRPGAGAQKMALYVERKFGRSRSLASSSERWGKGWA